ncbi:hypothetical protein A3A66_02060 [Microgenomates group bacterium RIFCSPLOWO2_01_FULL_46_13]|nr:MAG: hypothetical protein A2783_01830 [Microgenomates group bacterium RIFCSPHIGHO2_01_FULL_45_11]OGV94761.1 MAG: hypothetical protein A3A66_02060 [Microgenomates group bacterium RIFCSPLOWO2_01_FULL_46_13]
MTTITLNHWLKRLVFIALILSGLYSLSESVWHFFGIYPKLRILVTFDDYIQLLRQAFLLSLAGLAESTYGLIMLLRPTATVKRSQVAIGLLILLTIIYLKSLWQLPRSSWLPVMLRRAGF